MEKQLTTIEDFFATEPIPEEAWTAIRKILSAGSLFRYIQPKEESEVSLLEAEFAQLIGAKYALALNSCSSAMFLSLIAAGICKGDKVLIPAFTFAAVPSAVVHAGAIPILIETKDDYRIDIEDLKSKMDSDVKAVLISHMRGHTSDMDKIIDIANENSLTVIEDAAHSMGAQWNGRYIGTLGRAGCFSFQSYKLVNGGEGGMLVTDDEEIMVRAVYLSGAYEKNWQKHYGDSELYPHFQNVLPLFNLRLSNLSAAAIRPQLKLIQPRAKLGREMNKRITSLLSGCKYISLAKYDHRELPAPDSIQFNLIDFSVDEARTFMNAVRARGVSLYVFGSHPDNARVFWNWGFIEAKPELPQTVSMLNKACDIRLPLTFTDSQLCYIAEVIKEETAKIKASS